MTMTTLLFALNNRPTTRSREIRLPNATLDTIVDPRTESHEHAVPLKPLPLLDVLARVDALHAHCTRGGKIDHVCGGVPKFDLYTHYIKPLRAYNAAVALEAI